MPNNMRSMLVIWKADGSCEEIPIGADFLSVMLENGQDAFSMGFLGRGVEVWSSDRSSIAIELRFNGAVLIRKANP